MKRSTTFRIEANSNSPTTSAARTANVHSSLSWSRFDTACPSRRDIDSIAAVAREVACPGGEPGDGKREEAASGVRQDPQGRLVSDEDRNQPELRGEQLRRGCRPPHDAYRISDGEGHEEDQQHQGHDAAV